MTESSSTRNKRIAKNTLALYFRTFITMIVGLYTSRVMLQALGINDFGIFNVVGGIVSFGTLITGAITTGCSRFITYSLGTGDMKRMSTVFSTTVNIQIIMAIIAMIALEIGGIWFLTGEANIPSDRIDSAWWVLQCSILSMIIGLISVPYSASIIAHERMSLYAYTSIADALLKLLICIAISHFEGDRLILYAILLVATSVIMRIFYGWYCNHNFPETKYHAVLDRKLIKEMSGYSGWLLFGQASLVFNTQGINMLINVFFGLAYNAARGIAATVNGTVQKFVWNFMTAFSPSIIKSYAANDMKYCISLTYRAARISWFLMLIFLVPCFVEAHYLLKLWLGEVPEYAVMFVQFSLFESLSMVHGGSMETLIEATGKLKHYQIGVTFICFLMFPITWLCYHFGLPIWCANIGFIATYFLVDIPRFITLSKLTDFSPRHYCMRILVPCAIITAFSLSLPLLLAGVIEESAARFMIIVPISIIWTISLIYSFGLNSGEKSMVRDRIKVILTRLRFYSVRKNEL